jgi:hypothetical protein
MARLPLMPSGVTHPAEVKVDHLLSVAAVAGLKDLIS